MFHSSDCNHSCTSNASHSCEFLCNDGYMGNETLGERIKAIRVAAKDTLSQAGEKVGVSRQAFDKWEKGDTENMKLGNLLRFCDRYRVNLEALIRGDDSEIWRRSTSTPAAVIIAYDAAHEATASMPNEHRTLIKGFDLAGTETKNILLTIAQGVIEDFGRRGETN